MTQKFLYNGYMVGLDDINPDGSLRADFYDVVDVPLSEDNQMLADMLESVKSSGTISSVSRSDILKQAERLDMSTQEFESLLSKSMQNSPRFH